MTPRELLDRATAAINAGDADALLALYAPDAVQVGLERVLTGHAQLRPVIEDWLAARPQVRTLEAREAGDTIVFRATDGWTEGLGALLVHDGLIVREVVFDAPDADAVEVVPPRGAYLQPVTLEPYVAWEPRPVPDPRTAGKDALMPVVMEIVEAEGPVLAGRAFAIYTRASGGKKTTGAAKAPLTGAAWRLRIQGRLDIGREGVTTITDDEVLRPAGSPPVRVRELGPRTLEEVPLDEVAALMGMLRKAGAPDLKRAALDAYGLIRLTARADHYLESALALAGAAPG